MRNEEWAALNMCNAMIRTASIIDNCTLVIEILSLDNTVVEMKTNVVKEKSYAFALRIIQMHKHLSFEKKEFLLSKQILKSGTSIGANVEEADAAISKAEFSAKISIAYKEARETCYWLKLLWDSNYIDKKSFDSIFNDAEELCKLLYSILKSSGRLRNEQ